MKLVTQLNLSALLQKLQTAIVELRVEFLDESKGFRRENLLVAGLRWGGELEVFVIKNLFKNRKLIFIDFNTFET